MSKPLPKIDDLSVDDRLRLIEQLWESLRTTPDALPLTDAQRAELDRRIDALEKDGPVGIPWSEVDRQIRKRSG